ncbi:MAG: hypothetical protein EAZ36_07030 [Verrucomicrobia bacterium]|nr:MAG: hypothetical protein EAZ36_07030 [Verrucomicrobiota bacterium]
MCFLGAACLSSGKKNDGPVVVARFMLEAVGGDSAGVVRLPISGTLINLAPKSQLTEYDIVKCEVVENELGQSLVFQLSSRASRDLYRLTVTNQGKRLVLVINGQALGARRIERPWADGFIVMYAELPAEELPALAKDITRTSLDAQKDIAQQAK